MRTVNAPYTYKAEVSSWDNELQDSMKTSRQTYNLSEKRQLKPPQDLLPQRHISKDATSQRLPEDNS